VFGLRDFPKPIVVVSKCITFEPVRWDGRIIASEFVEKLKPYVKFVPVCPEVEIGLGVPRDPVRIVLVNGEQRLLQPSTGLDFSEKMKSFAEWFLDSLSEVDGFILKSGSPSSGFKNVKIYPKTEKSVSVARGPGFFGKAVLEKFPHLAIEDERRLLNPRIEEHFLTKLFTLARFRSIKNSSSIRELVRFQAENKYLLTAYNQKELRALGRIVANQERKPVDELIKAYETNLHSAFKRSPSAGSNINVMLKVMGYFSHQLTQEEKSFFLSSLEKYRAGRLPLSACISILKSWIIRFQQEYLANQTFLEPYPEELTAVDTTIAGSEGKDYWK
jgi:uncharacterized protein YbgA (DUF1722 family)/uncharacterized protein YbbK (DUF523 family)